jgi:L-lactate utilization protein LutC
MGAGMSEQLAKLAAQQSALRQEMQRMAQELNKDGSGSGNGLDKLAEQMKENEKDLVNQQLTQESIHRQQDIMTRMLEAEKAERERELDQKRESTQGKELDHPDPARFFQYQQDRQREAELLRTVPPGLKPYYKARVDQYFDTFDRPR